MTPCHVRFVFLATLLLAAPGMLAAQPAEMQPLAPLGTAISYQGRLQDAGLPATGSYDLQLRLFDALGGGTQIGSTITAAAVAVSDGLFTVSLDFGGLAFNGSARWLEIAVRPAGSGVFSTLTPRQPLAPAPWALYANAAGGAAAGDLTGSYPSPAIAANAVTAAKIASGQVVKSLNGLEDAVVLGAGANITITPSGNTLTIAAPGGGGGGGVTAVNGITGAVTVNGTGTVAVGTAGNTITLTGSGLTTVTPGTGLTGQGTPGTPLGIANGGVGKDQLAASGGSSGQVLGTNGTALLWQSVAGGIGGGGAPGQVAFWTAPSTLAGTTSMTWDSVHGRLGLGTASPAEQLHLTGNLSLPDTAATAEGWPTAGIVRLGFQIFLHGYQKPGSEGVNVFLGQGAGNFTMGGESTWFGSYNIGLGVESLKSLTTGHFNTAAGAFSLTLDSTGWGNAAFGTSSLRANTDGIQNTAVGLNALYSNTTGNNNTAVGREALFSATTGIENTAVGSESLYSLTGASGNVAVGTRALFTLSYDPGWAPYTTYNTAVGYEALHSDQPTASSNGTGNSALGAFALRNNGIGSENTAAGFRALENSGTGNQNTALGYWSLKSNGTGQDNTAIGYSSLTSNADSNESVAVGASSLATCTTCFRSTAVGSQSLQYATGSQNIALGAQAGIDIGTGSSNIDIGNPGATGDSNAIRIGTAGYQTRTFVAGIRGITTDINNAIPVLVDSSGQLGTFSSSIRFKEDVRDIADLSERVLALRPVSFRYKGQVGPRHFGLIAEEVEQVLPELVIRDATGQVETVAYHELPAVLLSELQKQQARIAAQEVELASQRATIEALSARLEAIEKGLHRPSTSIDRSDSSTIGQVPQ